jgi:hypothetical protein
VLLVNALLIILFLSDTYGGRVHDKRIADATPYPLPARSRLLQDLGFLAFTLPQVEILMPTKKPRGEELTLEQQMANQALNQRRLRIEHVNSSVKRCVCCFSLGLSLSTCSSGALALRDAQASLCSFHACPFACPLSALAGCSGRRTVKVLPASTVLVTLTLPPWASVTARTRARPKPAPPWRRARALSTR